MSPQAIKGAAGVGVEGGKGVLLVRNEKTGMEVEFFKEE